MRLLTFSLFATAAFDWPLPWLDRAGTAALGFAFLALALAPGGLLRPRPARTNLPSEGEQLGESDDEDVGELLARVRPYLEFDQQL